MLELRLVQGLLLKKVVEAIEELVKHANFDCSDTGISLQAMDSSQVALVALLLRSEGFDHYHCDRNHSLGMNLDKMAKTLKYTGNDDIVTIRADDGTDTVKVILQSPTQGSTSRSDIRLMHIDSEHLRIPESEYHAIGRMPSAEFAWNCNVLSRFGDDTVAISVTSESVKFSTRDINVEFLQHTSPDKPEESTVIEMKEPVALTFDVRYMNLFAKATPLSNTVTISLSNDQPLAVEYKIAEMGYVRFYLAPKTQDDDDDEDHHYSSS